MRISSLAVVLLGASVSPLSGDVMVRIHNEMKFGVVLPQPVSDRTRNGGLMLLPDETTIYRKGNLEYQRQGAFVMLTDYGKQEVTLLDGEHKQYATIAMKDYVAKMAATLPPIPDDAKDANSQVKITITPLRKTGKTAKLNGIEVEEAEVTAFFDLPLPPKAPVTPSSPLVKATMLVWMAKAGETNRVAAVKELAAHTWPTPKFSHWINPGNVFAWAFGAYPGLGDSLSGMCEAVEKEKPIVLKWRLEIGLPGMVGIMKKAAAEGNKLPEGYDPEQPFTVVDSFTQEISTEKLPDAQFKVPADYKAASFEEVAKSVGPLPKS